MHEGMDWLPVSSLKGLGVYCENDLYDPALLILNLRYAKAAQEDTNLIARPTLNGLARAGGLSVMIRLRSCPFSKRSAQWPAVMRKCWRPSTSRQAEPK